MSDVEITYAEERAIDELARRLGPIVTIQDPRGFAKTFITDMRSEGWRPPLKPVPGWKQAVQQSSSAPNEAWKAARAALESGTGGDDGA